MNTFNIKIRLLPTLALACLSPLAFQNAQATETFSSYASMTYTIDSITNLTNTGDISELNLTGSFELAPGQEFEIITGDGSVTPSLLGYGDPSLIPGSSYSRKFQLDGTANNGGEVVTNYFTWFNLAFKNVSTTDSYAVGLTLYYELSAIGSSSSVSTDVTLNYFAEHINASGDSTFDQIFIGTDIASVNPDFGPTYLQNSSALSFTLAPKEFEAFYAGTGISGSLQASPVPSPSAIWLFASALLAMPNLRKAKRTV